MSAAPKLLQAIHHTLRHLVFHATEQTTHAPLLSPADITALSYLAENPTPAEEHQHEVAHRQYGDARSVYRGFGLDYEESRPYQAGDDLRFMNWRLSARSGELFMKVFREERKPSVFILLDRSSSMRFGSQRRLKVTQAARVATLIALRAQHQNTPVSGVILNPDPHWIQESRSGADAWAFIHAAKTPCPPIDEAGTAPGPAHIIRLLHGMLVQGSVVYLISDFHDYSAAEQPALLQLATQHRVCAIRITDAAEQQLPAAGQLNFSTGEDQPVQSIDTSQARTQMEYRQAYAEHRRRQEGLFNGADIPCLDLGSDDDDIAQHLPMY